MNENNQPELRALSEEELKELNRIYLNSGVQFKGDSLRIQRLLATINSLRAPEPKKQCLPYCQCAECKAARGEVNVPEPLGDLETEIDRILQLSTYQMRKLAIIELLESHIHQRDKALAQEIRDQEQRKDEEWGKRVKEVERNSAAKLPGFCVPCYKIQPLIVDGSQGYCTHCLKAGMVSICWICKRPVVGEPAYRTESQAGPFMYCGECWPPHKAIDSAMKGDTK